MATGPCWWTTNWRGVDCRRTGLWLPSGGHFVAVGRGFGCHRAGILAAVGRAFWLLSGGRVELGERPMATVAGKALEVLSLKAEFLHDRPAFLTVTKKPSARLWGIGICRHGTRSRGIGKPTDVRPLKMAAVNHDRSVKCGRSEFHQARWFHRSELPKGRSEPRLKRFWQKVAG